MQDTWQLEESAGHVQSARETGWKRFRALSTQAGIRTDPFAGIPTMALQTEGRRELKPREPAKVIRKADAELRHLFAVGIYTGIRQVSAFGPGAPGTPLLAISTAARPGTPVHAPPPRRKCRPRRS